MFLHALQKQNPALIEETIKLLENGIILPDTYVIDVDQFKENALQLKKEADKLGIKLYAMTKQFGRNPYLAKLLVNELHYAGIVCVDFKEARQLHAHGVKIAHVGHLVQPPKGMIKHLIEEIQPDVITVYSIEKAAEISKAAQHAQRTQRVLLKFLNPDDQLYINQESGFDIADIKAVLKTISTMPNLLIEGLTHFPCFLFDPATQTTQPTQNLRSLLQANEKGKALGYNFNQLNSPSSTSSETLPLIKEFGCTHGEPGHALTGTTPANQTGNQPEKVAMAYVTEVSHHFNNNSYCYGGGYYRRGLLDSALLRETDNNGTRDTITKVTNDDDSSIDYHLKLHHHCAIGTPVVMAFRTQVFVTRSDVALVKGISTQSPTLIGLYDALGNEVKNG
ncbi:YhfX family PLP-dependent enzyme [Photobacterium minamisatsumaniensis]|uniref:YhfX family PLP-dependent enzyme n=1 Tax=Photobacterium minamisatsumaniensis TaxID=2910233 RepID=UPI003D119595